MLKKITGDTKKPGLVAKATVLDKLSTAIQELAAKRNGVVHASWHPRYNLEKGRLLSLEVHPPPKAKEKAKGTGLKNRGTEVTIAIEYTSAEIRAIAKEIETVERGISAWGTRWLIQRQVKSALQPPWMSLSLPQASDFLAQRNLQAASPSTEGFLKGMNLGLLNMPWPSSANGSQGS